MGSMLNTHFYPCSKMDKFSKFTKYARVIIRHIDLIVKADKYKVAKIQNKRISN